MLPAAKLTPEQYLDLERIAEGKSEYLDGEMFAMSGGSPEHSLISANLARAVGNQLLDRPCRVYSSDLKVHVVSTGLYTYPDLSVVCGEPSVGVDAHRDVLLNPTLLIEVLSPTSEAYDRGEKFAHYRSIPSLREYVLVSQEKPLVETFLRRNKGGIWSFTEASGREATVELASIEVQVALAEIYAKVNLVREVGRTL